MPHLAYKIGTLCESISTFNMILAYRKRFPRSCHYLIKVGTGDHTVQTFIIMLVTLLFVNSLSLFPISVLPIFILHLLMSFLLDNQILFFNPCMDFFPLRFLE